MTEQAHLDELLSFIAGTGRYSLFGAGMHTYPNGDANDRLKYEMCLELEQQGKIRKHLVTKDFVIWMPTTITDGAREGVSNNSEL